MNGFEKERNQNISRFYFVLFIFEENEDNDHRMRLAGFAFSSKTY